MARTPGTKLWLQRHHEAMLAPAIGHEAAIVALWDSLTFFADAHRRQFEWLIGDDHVLGPAWRDMAKAFLTMLNGTTGRLDAGVLDGALRQLARDHNVDLDGEGEETPNVKDQECPSEPSLSRPGSGTSTS